MKVSTFLSIFFAAIAAGLIVFWNLRSDSLSSSATGSAVANQTGTLSERVDVTTDTLEEPVDADADQLERSAPEEAIGSRLARRQRDMADAIYQLSGIRVAQRLVESGLAPSDSEAIARRYAADVAECAMESFEVEAARQSISVGELLSQLEAAARDGGNPFDVVDRSRLEANALPCEADALQRAGIPYQPDAQVSEEEIERLRECVEDFKNSDITSRDIILETCSAEVFGEAP